MPSLDGPSAKLIPFPVRRSAAALRGPAEILFFTGIRYERASQPAADGEDSDSPRDPQGGASPAAAPCVPPRARRNRRRA